MKTFFHINYIRFASNFFSIIIKIVYKITFFVRTIKAKNNNLIEFIDFGNLKHSSKLLDNIIVIDGVEIYLPDYIYENNPKSMYARASNVIQLWDLGGLPLHLEKSIHSFDWLYDLRAINSTKSRKIAIAWVLEWVARYGGGKGPGWTIEIASKRLISLVENNDLFKELPFGGNEPHELLLVQVRRIISRTLKLLSILKPITFRHRDLFFLSAANFYGEYYKGTNKKVLGQYLQAVGRKSKALINKFGEVKSRNPEELLEIFGYLEKLRNYGQQLSVYGCGEGSFVDISIKNAARTLKALRFENGRLITAMGSDGGTDPLLNLLSSVDYPNVLNKDGIYMGFYVMKTNNVKIIVDVQSPPKIDSFGSAHAGLLSFELSSGLRKIIVNCGSGHRHDSYIQRQNRSTYAHSTLELSDQSQAEFHPIWPRSLRPADRMFSMTRKKTKIISELDNDLKVLAAEHSCYESRFELVHRRQFKLSSKGNELVGLDQLVDTGITKRKIPYRIYFHLHPDVEAWHLETNDSVILKLKNGETWLFTHKGGDMFLADSAYFGRGDTQVRKSKQIVVSSNKNKYIKSIEWRIQNQTSSVVRARDIGLENIGLQP